VVTRRLFVAAAVLAISACTVEKQPAPSLAGPSEMGVALNVQVTPDIITQDGRSEATLSVLALDANARPIPNLSLRTDIAVSGFPVDFGQLTSKTMFTDANGRASVKYIAPPSPPATSGAGDTRVTLAVTPIGSNYANSTARTVEVLVSPPGIRLGPNSLPLPKLTFSPNAPKDHESVFFSGAQSTDDGQIMTYSWDFGDGRTGSGMQCNHSYDLPGKYSVVLTVIDDRGLSASTAPVEVSVAANTNPVASFVTSPDGPRANVTTIFMNASGSTAAPGRAIVSYEWDFGDGSSGGGERVSHVYAAPGTYTIVLVVRDSAGASHQTTKTITVQP
jgi:PKD repeat protein